MLEAVIFDMDGVLVDSEPYHYNVETKVFNKLGINIPDSKRHTFVGMARNRMWGYIKESYKLEQSLDYLMTFDHDIRVEYFDALTDIQPIPGILPLLDEITQKGIKTAVASSSPIEVIDILLRKMKICTYFYTVVSGEFIEKGKPDPDIFIYTAKILNVKPANCIVIEDSLNGVRAAKSAEMSCIGYLNPNTEGQNLKDVDLKVESISSITVKAMEALLKGEN